MKTKFSRILGVVAVIALLASFLAVPVAADVDEANVAVDPEDISAKAEYIITFDVNDEVPLSSTLLVFREEVNGTAALVTTEAHSGAYSVELYVPNGVTDLGAVYVFLETPIALSTSNPTFEAYGVIELGDDPWNDGPYLNIMLDTNDNGQWDGVGGGDRVLEGVIATATTSYTAGFDEMESAKYYSSSAGSSILGSEHEDETVAVDLAHVLTHLDPDPDVLGVYIMLGYSNHTASPQTVYIDDVTIGDTTYDLDEAHGAADSAIDAGTITVEFPEGTVVADTWVNADVTVQSTSGFGDKNEPTLVGDHVVTTVDDDIYTVTIGLDQLEYAIAEAATVRVKFLGDQIENPDTPGDYTLWVSTSEEDDPVESESYEIGVPDVDVLPGIVELYNPSDILMDSETGAGAIQKMLNKALEGWIIKIGEGLYDGGIVTIEDKVTIEGSGNVEDIIIEGTWTILDTDITLDNLTLDGEGVATVINVGANDFTVQNCVLEDAADELIYDGGSAVDNPTIIEDCIFNIEDEIGVYANAPAAEITDCTFNVDEDGDGVGIEIHADITVTNCIFNGGSGVGVEVNAGDSEITGSTFDGLLTAFDIDGGKADINTNTIQNCEEVAIDVETATLVTIHNNTFTGNDEAALIAVEDLAENIYMMFNTITDNAGDDDLLIDNNDTTAKLECRNNWWGDADGPGDDAFSDDVEAEPFLPGPISASFIETGVKAGETADFEDDCGVQVDNDDDTAPLDPVGIVGAAQYTENPVAAISDAVGFWDICVVDAPAGVTIRLYTDVTKYTEVHVWGAARGEWLEASNATFNLFGGFMSIVVTDNTTPTLDDLGALPFVVVDSGKGTADAVEIDAPVVGATDVSVTPILAWSVVDDATYEVQITQDATFAILDEAATTPTNAYIVTTALAEGQSYYWRVRAVTDAGAGDWATGIFSTATPEPEKEPPITITEAPGAPEITVTIPAATVTQAIDPGLLWAIIGVGAVLVISLIVLIVRTRRAI